MRASKQLRSPPAQTSMVEVDDICAVDPLPLTPAANLPREPAVDDTVEIELTAEQMEALLSTGSPYSRG
jgi:hypothetical protein